MDFAVIRRLVITSMFADEWLMERLVLKGGNALDIVHRIGGRTSLDVDFSMASDFEDLQVAAQHLRHVLEDRFDSAGYVIFDFSLKSKPRTANAQRPTWGGYVAEFKIISKQLHAELGGDKHRMQVRSELTAPGQVRIFRIEISKHEHCEPRAQAELDGFTIFVYPTSLIAIEKLRAVCQQMPEYALIPARMKRPRARDFYDIVEILDAGFDFGAPASLATTEAVFAAKEVPLSLIPRIGKYREFHRPDWDAVVQSVNRPIESFDFYFDAVLDAMEALHPLWEE
jgi:predicted nucleotidyltransferase component of viral defense system